MSSARLGIFAVLATLTLGIGLFAWSALSTRRANTNVNENIAAVDIGETPAIDITKLTQPTEAVISLVEQGANAWIVGYDKTDPERIAYELFYEKLEPLAGGRVRVTKPQAWIYPLGSGPVYIRAQSASLFRPPGSAEPESGRFYAGTKIELFHLDDIPAIQTAREKLGADLTAADLPPSLGALTTESLAFSSVAGEVSTRDPVHIIAPGIDVRFTGFKALVDEPGKRLAYFRADGAGFLKYDPADARKESQRKNTNNKRAARNPNSSNSPRPPREDLYRAEFRGPIRLASQGATLDSDILETWLRLIDGALPADAIFHAAANAKSQTSTAPEPSSAAPTSPSRKSTLDPVTLTWGGPLELRPIQQTPAELREDHLAARFSSPTSGVVSLADPKSGASATGAALLTSATRGQLTLAGRGEKGVVLTAPDLAEVVGGSFSFDLASSAGAFHGPGVARLIGKAAAPDVPDPYEQTIAPEISWRHHCDLIFARDSAGAFNPNAPVLITEALFHDNVSVLHQLATIDGDFLRAIFDANAAAKPALSRLIIDGGVAVNAHDEGRLIAKRIDALFDLANTNTQAPRVITAAGDVHATTGGDELWAQLAEVHLATANDSTIVESFSADYDVIVKTNTGPEAYADHLRASWIDETLELFGEPAIARYQDGSITAGSMRFNQRDATLTVFGQSVFNYSQPRNAGIGYERVQVKCSRSMRYDDRTGLAEFVGDCIATTEPDDFARDVARGQRIALHFTPGAFEQNNRAQQSADALENAETPTDPLDTDSQVKLLNAVVYGWSNATADDGVAQVEARRYIADPTTESGLKLDRLAFLESAEIHLDAEANTLTTPGAGRLLFEDRRASRQNENNDNAIKTPRGTTLFEWDGAFFVNRAVGLARMTDRVRIRQRALESNTVTTLECAQLEAELAANNLPNDPGATTGAPQVKRLTASGAVYAAQGQRELIADRLIYNGISNTAEAFAAPGNMVTLFQPNIPAPLTGSSLRWRLTDDRIEWFDAGETTTPQ